MGKNQWIKLGIIWVLYIVLHFVYKYIPCGLTLLLSCSEETLFHHMKMAFFAYSLVSIAEYFLIKPSSRESFMSSRMISAILLSYFSFIIWMFVPLIFGEIHQAFLEILYSNLILGVSIFATIYLETFTEKIKFNKGITYVISTLYLIILAVFIISTFSTPDIEIFAPHEHGH